ncbi:MAG TPA: hypothetical protein P5561_05385, partial [Candidatus Omnitrophota bacterium]|nr:hypothetical protein [Candidatus Omnitrophota bacterium]
GIRKSQKGLRDDALYFGESQSRAIISVKPEHCKDVRNLAQKQGTTLFEIGKVGGDTLILEDRVRLLVWDAANLFDRTIPNVMERK